MGAGQRLMRRLARYTLLSGAGILIVVAAYAWLLFVGFGIAYGDLRGVPGSERGLAELESHAYTALAVAASCVRGGGGGRCVVDALASASAESGTTDPLTGICRYGRPSHVRSRQWRLG